MTGRYWIKLWIDILQDRKMAELSDRLWRRFIELLLIAKAEDDAGLLPDLFWTARQLGLSEEALETDLVELGKIGLVAQKDGRWLVPKFMERQTAKGGAERKKRERIWDMSRSGRERVADSGRGRGEEEAEEETEGEVEPEAEVDGFGPVVLAWEKACGPITPMIAEHLGDLADEAESHRRTLPAESQGWVASGNEWVIEAIREAASSARSGGISVRFVSAILSRWEREGYKAAFGKEAQTNVVDTWLEKQHGK